MSNVALMNAARKDKALIRISAKQYEALVGCATALRDVVQCAQRGDPYSPKDLLSPFFDDLKRLESTGFKLP
jgi:hypothetical protein